MKLSINFKILLLLLLSISVTLNGCSSSKSKNKTDNKKSYTYFRIYADADDNNIFVKLQDELGIEPKMERYTIVVNISKDNPEPFIIIGDIEETSPMKYPWSKLSKDIQQGLINWSGDNKEKL